METTEIMETTEATVEEVIEASSGKTVKTLGIVGGVLLVGGLVYKFGVPAIKKLDEKRRLKNHGRFKWTKECEEKFVNEEN